MKKLPKFIVFILVALMSFSSFTACGDFGKEGGASSGADSGAVTETPEEILGSLDMNFIDDLNKDLVKKIDDGDVKGDVNVIVTLSDNSLVSLYNEKGAEYESVSEFGKSESAREYLSSSASRRARVESRLKSAGLISEVVYGYDTVLDGLCVSTTYDKVAAICDVPEVERVMISQTYAPSETVTNEVNVHDTGIFDSSDVPYTGKGTVVAVLDTGCDYTHSAFTSHQVVEPRLDKDDIEELLRDTKAYGYNSNIAARDVYYGNVTKNKIAFGFDYADRDADIMPFEQSHGTHVAGIIAGSDSRITGVAVDAQLAIMKVFSDYKSGSEESDILAALEDAVILGVDAINLSLGMSCGFSDESHDEYKDGIYNSINDAGISLVVAASNDYSSAFGSELGDTNKTSNPDSATVGSPSTYAAALSVASIEGQKEKFMVSDAGREIFFIESSNLAGKEYDFFQMLGVSETNTRLSYQYVTVPGVGRPVNYMGLDVEGKIALVRRGDTSFEDKVRAAADAGAKAVIVYNNVFGDIKMSVGNNPRIPVISIGKDDGFALAEKKEGTLVFDFGNVAGPFMSDFSSWGPTPDLKIKPEITAHGGNILSAVPGGGYDSLSGTSMASPNMCGITVLIRQYVKEKFPSLTINEMRDMVNRLCMSTATIALDKAGNPYSPRKQGAGLASLYNSVNTKAYLYVDGIDKSKLELGDDPSRTGVYEMSFNLANISNETVSYRIDDFTMTETLSSTDKEFVAEMAYMLDNSTDITVEAGGALSGSTITVPAGDTAKITVTVRLSKSDKSYLNANFENGMYVEGYITLKNTDANGVDLNIPYLAFYGDWADAPLFDKTYYEVESEAHDGSIDEDDKLKADHYATTPYGKYFYDYVFPLGTYVYNLDENKYSAIPATEEHAAMSYYSDSISGLFGLYAGLLRGAKQLDLEMINTATGEVVWKNTEYNCYKAHNTKPYFSEIELSSMDIGENNMHFQVNVKAMLDWDGDTRNSRDTYSFSFYIDYEPPTIVNSEFRTEYDESAKENRYFVDLTVYDNHYAMAVRPVLVYSTKDSDGKTKRTYTSLSESAIPLYQDVRGSESTVTIEITDYMQRIKESDIPDGMVFAIDDYALNTSVCYVPFPGTDSDMLAFEESELSLRPGQTADLTEIIIGNDNATVDSELYYSYLSHLKWNSSNENVVKVSGGQIEAISGGTSNVSFIWKDSSGNEHSQSIKITVEGAPVTDNSNGGANVSLKELKFTHYDTIKAFNGDISRSDIGASGSLNYFDENCSISFYPSEKVRLHYSLKPWNLAVSDRYKLRYSSTNPTIASVDENGVVTANKEGRCQIYLEIMLDGSDRPSVIKARCSIEVKNEFVIEHNELVAYKGKGGDVVIPDDKGILYIGSFAFCHYDMVNDREVEDDYDIDAKKDPLGNDTVTSVVIPDGIEEVRKYAFYNCTALKKVTLGKDCERLLDYAFYGDTKLESINLENVLVIGAAGFFGCTSLERVNTSNVVSLGMYAFSGSSITSVNLTNLRWCGTRAFGRVPDPDDESKPLANGAVWLTTVTVGANTQLSVGMFEGCSRIATIRGDINAVQIPDKAFAGCYSLNSVSFSNNITYLGVNAFADCTGLSSVTFKGECEYIADSAFSNTPKLKTFTLPSGEITFGNMVFARSGVSNFVFAKTSRIKDIGVSVFSGTANAVSLTATGSDYYESKNGDLYSKDGKTLILVAPNKNLGAFNLPANVEEIGAGAFAGNSSLTSFTASGSALKSIGNAAFSDCVNLTSVTLPNTCTYIGDNAFFGANKLASFKGDKVAHFGDYSFANTALTEVTVPAGAEVGEAAFAAVGNFKSVLKTVNVGAGATLGEGAFMECGALETVNMPNEGGVTIVGMTFYNCAKLANIDMRKIGSDGENCIVGYASFYGCSSLTTANLANVTAIGDYCFAGCSSLATVSLPKVLYIGADAFTSTNYSVNNAPVITVLDMPEVQYIDTGAFDGLKSLTTVRLPKIVEIADGGAYTMGSNQSYIFSGAFSNCENLTSVEMGTLARLPDFVFYNCGKLANIDLSKVKYIGIMALGGVPITNANLTECIEIGTQAFSLYNQNNEKLVSVNAPELAVLNDGAFSSCVNLASVNMPKLQSMGVSAFGGCTSLTEFALSANLKNVDYRAFYGAAALTGFTYNGQSDAVTDNFVLDKGVLYTVLPNGGYQLSVYPAGKTDSEYSVIENTRRIEFGAAEGNKSLKKVILPSSLKNIGNMAFYECSALKEVVFNSYYAPQLEGTVSIEVEITLENLSEYPKYAELYKYNYNFLFAGNVHMSEAFYYQNFVDTVTSKNASELVYTYPKNGSGYKSPLYRAYFNDNVDGEGNRVDSGTATGANVLAFLAAYEKLPSGNIATRFDADAIINARTALNALSASERAELDPAKVARFESLEKTYNADVVSYAITRIFDVDRSEYSYNLIRDVFKSYNALTEEEKSLVTNYSVLQGKLSDLRNEMANEIDFNKDYSEYTFPSEEKGGCGCGSAMETTATFGGILAVCLAMVAGIIFGRKRRTNR